MTFKRAFFLIISFLSLLNQTLSGQKYDNLELESKIDTYVKPYLDMDAWSGVISIYQDGNPIFQKPYGYADREWKIPLTAGTRFRIASISKLFTEVAILKLVEEDEISLDDRLSRFIPDYPRGDEISLNHLLTHYSGIPHLNSYPEYKDLIRFDYSIDDIIELFKHKPLDFEPGKKYRYSNSGYVLLAYIIEHQTNMSFKEYIENALIAGTRLRNTGVDNEKEIVNQRARGYMFDAMGRLINAEYVNMSIKIGGGSLYSTADDLYKFVQALLNKEILESTLLKLPNFGEKNTEKVFTANGRVQGFCHQIVHRIEQDLTIIILGNHYSNIALPISDDIYRIFSGGHYEIPKNYLTQKVKLPREKLKKYEGVYDFGFGPVGKVTVVKNNLCYRAPGKDSCDALIPLGNDRFFYIQNWVLLDFKNIKENGFQTLHWIMGDNVYPASRLETSEKGK